MGTAARASEPGAVATVAPGDMKLEVVIFPVTDVERAKEFYVKRLGWRLDVTPPGIVQLTPPGSSCSLQFGPGLTSAAPGSGSGFLVVSDIVASRDALKAAGVHVSDFFHPGEKGMEPGLDPQRRSYLSFAAFRDPDGNSWLMQEITTRWPGRVDSGVTSYGSTNDLASALRRAATAHGRHEQRTGTADANWPDWYAKYLAAEQTGAELPQ